MINKPDISIIIVNYNVKDLLLKCITSIYHFTLNESFEIIVIDNNSNDGSHGALLDKYPDVKLIQNNWNAGFPAANNQGIKLATGNFIFLLNPDTELIEDSIAVLRKFLSKQNAEVGIVTPQLLNSDCSIQRSIFRFPRIRYILAEMLYLDGLAKSKYYSEKDLQTCFEVDSASGAALFFKKELIDKIGMLNEKLFWIEDVDFCFRANKNGYKTLYVPLTRIIHHSGQSAVKNYNVSISNQVFNKIKFYKVHGTGIQVSFIYIISILNVIARTIIFSLLSVFRKIYFRKAKAYGYTLIKLLNTLSSL
jgi:GT2 family glycosyltransferase